jgi:hypothetical protein
MRSPEIQDLIREHAERLDTETQPVRFDELRGTTELPLAKPRSRRTGLLRGSLVAAGSALVVLAAVGGAMIILTIGSDDTGPVTDTVATTVTTQAPPTTVSLGSSSPFGSGWTAVKPEAFPGAIPEGVEAVIEVDSLLLAKGAVCDVSGCRSSVWTSTDGGTWTEVPDAVSVFANTAGMAWASGGPGVVAVGSVCTDSGEGGAESFEDGSELACRVVAWSSPDGIIWSQVPDEDALLPTCDGPCELAVEEVVAAPFGLVARGIVTQIRGTDPLVVDDDSFLLFSEDGLKWKVSSRQPAAVEHFKSLLPIGQSVVALGDPALWTTTDGQTWVQITDGYQPPFPRRPAQPPDGYQLAGSSFEDAVVFGHRLVAVGHGDFGDNEGERSAAWYSEDGVTWHEAAMVRSTTDLGTGLTVVTVIDESLIAFTWPDSEGRVTIWTSTDGLTWTEEPGVRPQLGGIVNKPDLVAAGPDLWAAGFAGTRETAAALWVWRPPGN